MSFQTADPVSLLLFILFSFLMLAAVIKAIHVTSKSKEWLTNFSILIFLYFVSAQSGLVINHFIPFAPFLFLLLFIFSGLFSFSRAGTELAEKLPFALLIGFQGFRLPLELILHHWANLGTVPPTMTWTGQNWDIISGALAIVAIPFVNKNRYIARTVNLIGFILLLNVIRVVVLSSPLPFAWQLEKPLLLIAYFPYNLIAPLFVMPALIGHLITFRKLKR